MPLVRIPVLSQEIEIELPADWQTQVLEVREAPALCESELAASFDHPLGTAPLEEMARGKRNVIVVVDDAMRPTPAHLIAPIVVRRLLAAGVSAAHIRFVVATALHRAANGRDLIQKLGSDIVEHFEILPHNPYENLVNLGTTPRGIPVWVNRWVAESDLRIGISGVLPHAGAGFGGGAKIVMPGVCGIETIAAHHEGVPRGGNRLTGNLWRDEIEQIARMVGLELSANVVLNGQGQPAGVFVGDMVLAHRAAAALATRLYKTTLPTGMDIAITSGFPLDQEIGQARKAVRVAVQCVRPGGAVVLFGECPEGAGFHALYGAGGRCQAKAQSGIAQTLAGRQVWVCSSGLTHFAARQYLPETTIVVRDPQDLVARLAESYPRARAVVLKQGMLLFA
jgi:lactate racemase